MDGQHGGQGWEKIGNKRKKRLKVRKIDCGRMLVNVK